MRHIDKALRAVLAGACCWALTACEKRRDHEAAVDSVVEEKTEAPHSWIRRNDDIDPALWLASKEAGRQLANNDPAVARVRKAFESGASKYLESDRMIANRTAQLADMLAKDGKPETAADLIEGLSSVVKADYGKETYGELCQFYFILRHNGADQEAALAQLRGRFATNRRDGN